MKFVRLLLLFITIHVSSHGQDTFSIVAVDAVTGEVGSAGASCVDLIAVFPNYPIDFLGDLIPGIGAINTQASYLAANQTNARTRMLAGDNPSQIISWLVANDAQANPGTRQYGVAELVNGFSQTAGHTGASCLNYKNHIAGQNYCIQGNILLGQSVLDSMEQRFLREPGDLACKLMAALQGAKVSGADTRCASNGTSSLFAFIKVSQPGDPYGSPSLSLGVKTQSGAHIEPIDSLQIIFSDAHVCAVSGLNESDKQNLITVFPIPSKGGINVKLANNQFIGGHYSLMDVQHRILSSGEIKEREFSVSLLDSKAGNCLLQIEKDGESFVKKVVVE